MIDVPSLNIHELMKNRNRTVIDFYSKPETDKCASLIKSDSILLWESCQSYICDSAHKENNLMTKNMCSRICKCREIDVSSLINHFVISKPRECLNEVTWTVYAIFKCTGPVSCTLGT